jgi:3-hydroxyisobutyrate dehydrogenase-like beta-hydroxyacid dehydrogenase
VNAVGVVGLGAMGRPVAARLAAAGFDTIGYDADPAVAVAGVRRVGSLADLIASGYHVLGPVGAGQVAKTASNLLHWAEIVAITEALRLAAGYGVAPRVLREALRGGGTDSRTLRELDLMRFTWYAKDLAIARELAGGIGLDLPVAALAGRLMDQVSVTSTRDLLG